LMPGYVVAVTGDITDPAAFSPYTGQTTPAIAQYGGKVVMAGRPVEQLEGEWQPESTIFIVEFESVERARSWYYGPEYSEARKLRAGAVTAEHLVLVESVEG
jgi:uncharacterized protein (DUF1330 family)